MAQLLAISDYWWDWGDLLFRWLHVIAAIAWIGSSFYFIALDHHLRPPAEERDEERGVGGEAWEIHGGGFYRVEKFTVAPQTLPEPLHWFKWEAYTTWLSGFALLTVAYFVQADTFLIDKTVADMTTWEAVAIAVGGLLIAWVVYDELCRLLGRWEWALAAALLGFVALSAWVAGELLAARAAYVEVGAMLGTMMVGNVFFVIIPAHRELVRAKEAGREPDPGWNRRGKQRSVHNNYLTLPVVFAMLSNHFPFTYGHEHAWLVLVALMAIGAWVRHYFNLRHLGQEAWWIPVSAAVAVVALAIALRPADSPAVHAGGPAPTFEQAHSIILARCATCHSLAPTQPGVTVAAPGGVILENREQIEALASAIKTQAIDTRVMPPGNVTNMTDAERDTLARWLESR